ncbi:dTDP-4-dehydrorhamnose 3,5-epimerase family protein [Tessaracoccus sp. Z1128]
MHELRITHTEIPGLLILHLGVQYNDDGWFKENWHRAKMTALGLPDFQPVQHNVTHMVQRGITRGFLAEPWDRLVSVVRGRAMGAWVDLRAGEGYGRTFTTDLDPNTAAFVPRGVANGHQVLEDDTTLTYLLDHHWSAQARRTYSSINLFDPALHIPWPISSDRAIVAHRDSLYPLLADATPVEPRRTLVLGTDTPLGRALRAALPRADGISAEDLDGPDAVDASAYDTLVHAHGATATGRPGETGARESWSVAAGRAQRLADLARRHGMRYVHVSSDCPFDRPAPEHPENHQLSLATAHGQALAAGETVAAGVPRHLVVRTGWVAGRDEGFVHDLVTSARHGQRVTVDGERSGRLTFATQLAAGITHLLDAGVAAGTYNLTGDGRVGSAGPMWPGASTKRWAPIRGWCRPPSGIQAVRPWRRGCSASNGSRPAVSGLETRGWI